MANHENCVFCGEKLSFFHSYTMHCAGSRYPCCKNCANELQEASEEELCRRALRLGLVQPPDRLEERLALLTEAEEHRPACLRCGVKLKFGRVQQLDNTPIRDGMFTETFDVQPAYCEACGKIEFYHPDYVARNKFWAFLAEKDTEA